MLKELFVNGLDVSEKEWTALCNYGYADHYNPDETLKIWQNRMKEAMMEDQEFEMKSGERIFKGNDKNLIINVLNR
jgi:hypothetical protein